MLTENTLNWLKIALIPEIGPIRGKRLLERFQEPGKILTARQSEIAAVLDNNIAQAIVKKRENLDLDTQLRLIKQHRVKIVAFDDAAYPAILKHIYDPPLVLFQQGEDLTQKQAAIAIVGTRMATIYGRNMARKISSQLSERGYTIISGGARGIDTAAHQAALSVNASTVAVLGSGLDVVYPLENFRLFQQIAQKGTMLSEYPMGTRPFRQNFPQRNRIVSGLCLGVVVIEAPAKSGALITASFALEQGREVFCVPGQADSFTMKGSHQLLREGAVLIEDVEDIIKEIGPRIGLLTNREKNENSISHC